jgi:hypothetical protein
LLVIEGGLTQNLSAKDLAELGFCAVAYPWTLVAAKLKSIRETLEALKKSMTEGAPPMILSYAEVCEGVGFNRYWVSLPFISQSTKANAAQDEEERYKYSEDGLVEGEATANGHDSLNGHQ